MSPRAVFVVLALALAALADPREELVASTLGDAFVLRLRAAGGFDATKSCFKIVSGDVGDKCGFINSDTVRGCQSYSSYCNITSEDGFTGVCVAQFPEGAYCNKSKYPSAQCSGYYLQNACRDNGNNNTCTKGGHLLGQACWDDTDCVGYTYVGKGLGYNFAYCANSVCTAPPLLSLGANCSGFDGGVTCPPGSSCRSGETAYTCQQLLVNGSACNYTIQCRGTCVENICLDDYVQPNGAPCGDSSSCLKGLSCYMGVCVSPPDLDVVCDPGTSSCPSNFQCLCDRGRQKFVCQLAEYSDYGDEYTKLRDCILSSPWSTCEPLYVNLRKYQYTIEENAAAPASVAVATAVASILLSALL